MLISKTMGSTMEKTKVLNMIQHYEVRQRELQPKIDLLTQEISIRKLELRRMVDEYQANVRQLKLWKKLK
jgi:hypothetical protein